MGTVKSTKAKVLVALIIFMIMFSNCGYTLSAIATSDGFQVITNGFFRKDEISFKAYFEDENGNEISQIVANVNQKAKLILEILPQVQGYLKTADLKAVSADGSDVNFKITNISYYEDENSSLEVKQEKNAEISESELNSEEGGEVQEPATTESQPIETITTVENEVTNTTVENEVTNTAENVTTNTTENVETEDNTVVDELSGQAAISTNTVSGASNTTAQNVVSEVSNGLDNEKAVLDDNEIATSDERGPVEVITQTVEEPATSTEVENEEDILIDEDKVIEEKTEEANEELLDLPFGMKIISNNEIEVMNIIKGTKLVLDIEYEMGDTLNVENLMKDIHLQLSGTYINSDLEDVPVAKEDTVTLGWKYTKDVELTSEYTKFSPFEVGDINGTIVENRITVKREVLDEKFLPIKNTKLEVGVPEVNGKKPIEISIIGEKLLATKGEDTGYTTFSKENWSYDAGTGKIQISVENTKLVYASGLDEYVIIYRYEDKIDAENSNLGKDVHLTIEEYSARENHKIEKEIKEMQNIKVDVGELVTYSISSTEEKINKAKIYANYNNEIPIYETEYTNQVNVNILTSDILEELKINCNQELYKDSNSFEFAAEGVEYRRIKFSFFEISTLLVNGGEIVITNEAGEVLYTLNKEIIKSEEDCIVNLNGETGIIIYARNIAKNGSLNFELVKVIKACNYDRAAFKNFTSLESRITAEVKYQKIEETLVLPVIGTEKYFEEASTYARLSLNKETLSTTKSNENVEIKIELNNDKENSNLYVNPAFEIVFPKYVNDVTIQNLNVLYENGLKVSKADTYKEHDITKIKIEFEGTQKTFSESSITNGTNIIINANIKVDEYTPKKEDQIKLYYCNEGVSTYESQTKWTISKPIPNGILKTTNGFDVAIIKYQAPSGLIAINGIVNYDGNLSEVKSVKQGEIKEEIETNGASKIMTMELLALNNTDNKCSDVVLVGRIPFAGVRDVVNNRDLGTTVDTVMKDLIREDTLNTNTVDIYYSTNPEATKELDNIGNGWSREVSDMTQIKSFLIFVKGAMQPGQVLRYTYDFEIPANLPYETNIEGSFGAFYNNNSDIAVIYESSSADPVGLSTETGPKVEATLSVDIGDGTEVGECRYLTYDIIIKNTGSIVAENVIVSMESPKNTMWCRYIEDNGYGNNNYEEDIAGIRQFSAGTLNPGEEKGYSLVAKVAQISSELGTQDESSVIAQAAIKADNLGITIESNQVINKIIKSNFDIQVNTPVPPPIPVGSEMTYLGTIQNITGETLKNVKAVWTFPSVVEFVSSEENETNQGWSYDENTRTATKIFDEIEAGRGENCYIRVKVVGSSIEPQITYLTIHSEDGKEDKSSDIRAIYTGAGLSAKQTSNITSGRVLEGNDVEFNIEITNSGNLEASNFNIFDEISPNLIDAKAVLSESNVIVPINNGKIEYTVLSLPIGQTLTLKITGKAASLDNGTKTIENKAKIEYNLKDFTETNKITISIEKNPNKNNGDATNVNNNNNQQSSSDTYTSTVSNSSKKPNTSTNVATSNNSVNTQSKTGIYSVSGLVWIDENQNGRKDAEEGFVSSVKVSLNKENSVIAVTTTNTKGEYSFKNLADGEYYAVFEYDDSKYKPTIYQNNNVEQELNSKAVEISEGKATTNAINITDSNVANINLGLQEKERFDLTIEKVITKATVISGKNTESFDYNDENLGKIEIKSSKLKDSIVELEYKINVINSGDNAGKAISVRDMLPEEMQFDENKNAGWNLGTDGYVYNTTLKDVTIAPGEKRELKLVLTKAMNEENTGVVSNVVQLSETESDTEFTDDLDNNFATQEMLILVKTGFDGEYTIVFTTILLMAAIIYLNRNKLLNILNDKTNNYKNTEHKNKISMKKRYK